MLAATALTALPLAAPMRAFAQAPAASRLARADAVAKRVLAAPPLQPPALSLAVANTQGVMWSVALGTADIEQGVATTPMHSFRIGSVSKVVTTTAAARLVSRGVLDLDVPISTWLPDLPAAHRQTTMKQLFTHRSGIRHYLPKDFDPKAPDGAIFQRMYPGNAEILALFINDPLLSTPGTNIFYSTFGYTLASLVMEAAAKQSFLQLIEGEVAKVFGLASLTHDDPLAIVPLRATGYSSAMDMRLAAPAAAAHFYPEGGMAWRNMPYFSSAYCWAGGGLLMSPPDLARFGAALLESPVAKVTAAERALLFTPLTEQSGPMPPLGLGWRLDTDGKGRRRLHHAGTTLGGRSNLVIYPDQRLSIAISSNVLATPGNVLQPSSDLADIFA
jgi:serine beta-lactamase-like protein LACTB